jgi:hypothetical protein
VQHLALDRPLAVDARMPLNLSLLVHPPASRLMALSFSSNTKHEMEQHAVIKATGGEATREKES